LRTKLLWKIRRKLIISYLLIGLVPTVLILFFFLLTAYLVFGQVSSYILSASLEKVEAEAAHGADLVVADLLRIRARSGSRIPNQDIEKTLKQRLIPLTQRFPGAAAVYLEETGGTIRRRLVVGGVQGLPPPGTELPDWARGSYSGL
jgi:hypothetical protein